MEDIKDLNITAESAESECIELKNIKYKTMLLSGNVPKETTISDNMSNLDKFLENDKINNNSLNELPWSKLDKTIKTVKILQYTEKYTLENLLSSSEKQSLIIFLKDCLDKKKLQRVKDVEYIKEIGEIKSIPALQYAKLTKHFTLKNLDKRVSTSKNLPPKKGSIKNTKLCVAIEEEDAATGTDATDAEIA